MGQVITFEDYTPAPRYDATPWTAAQIEEAESASGPWTLIDEITLSPVDSNPASPATRNFTTEAASETPALWYRIVFVDETGDDSQPTTPVRNSKAGPPAQFATSDEFAARLGLTLTAAEQARADILLGLASGLIRSETGQTISLVEDDTLTMPSEASDRIRLPQRPVVSVTSVAIDGTDIPENGAWYLDGDELVRSNWRMLVQTHFAAYSGIGWLGPLRTISIVYTHGFTDDEIPTVVKAVCMEMAARVWANPGNVIQENVGDTSTTYGPYVSPPRGLMLSDEERARLNDRLRRQAGSVTLR